jgi:hypothetical protein
MSTITTIRSEFETATMHPASIIPLDRAYCLEDIHPASLPSSSRLVTDGYGELILRVKEGGTLRAVTKEEYAKAYCIFQKYAPRLEEDPKPLEKSRIQMIREELKGINPNMVATFIPRTLFELIFIKKVQEEDAKIEKRPYEIGKSYKNSWTFYDTPAPLEVYNLSSVDLHLPKFIDLGSRLNQAAIEEINQIEKEVEDLSYSQIQKLFDDQIAALELNTSEYLVSKISIATKELLNKAVFIESHESCIGKIVLYRGGELATDSPMRFGKPYSISLGISIFAGLFKDITACAYTYMRHRDAYALVLDPAKESLRMIRVVPLTAIEALFGVGEMWHCRFLCSKEEETEDPENLDAIGGVNIEGDGFLNWRSLSERYKLLKNQFTRELTIETFALLKEKNLFLFHSKMSGAGGQTGNSPG